MRLHLVDDRPALLLAACASILGVLSVIATTAQLRGVALPGGPLLGQLFDVNRERNIPTWLATAALAVCALALWTVARETPADAGLSAGWYVLSLGFTGMSVDEALSLHEQATGPLRDALGTSGGLLHNAWIVLAAPVAGAVLLCFVPFLRRLPRAVRRGLLLAGVVYGMAVFGVEALAGLVTLQAGSSMTFIALTTIEEMLEFGGVCLVLLVVGSHQRSQRQPVAEDAAAAAVVAGSGPAVR